MELASVGKGVRQGTYALPSSISQAYLTTPFIYEVRAPELLFNQSCFLHAISNESSESRLIRCPVP